MTLLLDTHALLWWLIGGGGLSREQSEVLELSESSGGRLAIATISLWEIAKLVERGRLELSRAVDVLFDDLERHPRLAALPITPRIALESTRLGPEFPRDPADQIIAATARVHGMTLITADKRIRGSHAVDVI